MCSRSALHNRVTATAKAALTRVAHPCACSDQFLRWTVLRGTANTTRLTAAGFPPYRSGEPRLCWGFVLGFTLYSCPNPPVCQLHCRVGPEKNVFPQPERTVKCVQRALARERPLRTIATASRTESAMLNSCCRVRLTLLLIIVAHSVAT